MVRSAILMLLLLAAPLGAVEKIRVLALFPGKAMLSIDGRQRMLRQGAASPEGVTLISADPEQAVVVVGGHRQTLKLGSSVASRYRKKKRLEARVLMNNQGAYAIQGTINGYSLPMVVDTGANTVALSERHARGLNLQYRRTGRETRVETASGVARAWSITLDRVKIGEIELRHIPAVVMEGELPGEVLLGMSFLSSLQIRHQGNLMLLSKSQ
jgi:aspartyl protease family protein